MNQCRILDLLEPVAFCDKGSCILNKAAEQGFETAWVKRLQVQILFLRPLSLFKGFKGLLSVIKVLF